MAWLDDPTILAVFAALATYLANFTYATFNQPPPRPDYKLTAELEHECHILPHVDPRVIEVCKSKDLHPELYPELAHPLLQKDSNGRRVDVPDNVILLKNGIMTPNEIRKIKESFQKQDDEKARNEILFVDAMMAMQTYSSPVAHEEDVV